MSASGHERRWAAAAGAALLVAGCSDPGGNAAAAGGNASTEAPAPAANSAAAVQAPALQLEAEGLRLAGASLPFGTAQSELLERVDPHSEAEIGTNSECGAGPMTIAQLPGGLSLLFQEERFAGWSADGREPNIAATASGIAAGVSTRAQLEAAYPDLGVEESTLGREFSGGGLGGLLDGDGPQARVTALWAGTTCMFR